jgi:hypothetical protein
MIDIYKEYSISFFKLHNTTQTLTTRTYTHPTPMSTSDGLSTSRLEILEVTTDTSALLGTSLTT